MCYGDGMNDIDKKLLKRDDLITEYKREYFRVNNREPVITCTKAWITINGNSVRKGELINALEALRGRFDFAKQ